VLVEADGLQAFDLSGRIAALKGLKAATGLIADQWFAHPSGELDVLAVTGTNGKTTTAWWLAHALESDAERTHRLCAGGHLGGRAACAGVDGMTTPDPVLLQRAFRSYADQGLAACAIEASSIGIVEHRLDGSKIRVALFTNFTQDHLDYHGSMDAYWQAKAQLFDWPGLPAAVVNIDDARRQLWARLRAVRWMSGAFPSRDRRACRPGHRTGRRRPELYRAGSRSQPAHEYARLVGQYNVSNLRGAGRCCLGLTLEQAVQPVPS
jgi:UDP-N-acetylmuramoyl-L-alanyl-D-glutamate--2,6-diaminopimelate ligase